MLRLILASLVLATPLCAFAHGIIESLRGEVQVGNNAVSQGRRVVAPSAVTTGAGAQASLKFDDGTQIVLGENSLLRVQDYRYQPTPPGVTPGPSGDRAVFELLRGSARVVTGKIVVNNPKEFHFRTPQTELSVERGADFQVALVNPAYIHVNAGTVISNNGWGSPVALNAGTTSIVATSSTAPAAISIAQLPAGASSAMGSLSVASVSAPAGGGAASVGVATTAAGVGGAAAAALPIVVVGGVIAAAAAAGSGDDLPQTTTTTHH
jgi:hypothetical protein